MKLRWLVALAVICTLVWVSGAAAGPSRPAGGDPDIWERSKGNNPNYSVGSVALHAQVLSTIDLVIYRVNLSLKQQDARQSAKADISNLPSVSTRDRNWR